MDREKYGVHISHCCYIHGCKYGDEDCPVVSGEVAQKHLCYDCSEEYEPYTLEEIERLRKTKSYRPTYEQLKDKVADLEAKLAESEAKIACREDEIKFKEADINQLKWILEGKKKDIDQLKQQLAESEKKVDEFHDKLLDEIQNKVDREVELTNCLNNVVDERDQLKQQLAEKDQAIEGLQEINQSLGQTCNNDAKEIERLRERLAEKDVEIEKLKKGVYKVTLGTTPSNQIDFTENFYVIQNQTAIAELEKLRKKACMVFWAINNEKYLNLVKEIIDQIDQQIKSLKGEK